MAKNRFVQVDAPSPGSQSQKAHHPVLQGCRFEPEGSQILESSSLAARHPDYPVHRSVLERVPSLEMSLAWWARRLVLREL
jgi:hypothetical protein